MKNFSPFVTILILSASLASADSPSTAPPWTAEGNQAGARLGFALASAGDVNGDGYADVIMSAPDFDNGQTDEGMVSVYYGSATGLPATPAWSVESNQEKGFLAFSVASAGDVNKDGYADVILGAPLFDSPQVNEGKVFVYYGSANGLPTTPSWTAESNQSGALFGARVETAGDVNGDGYSDVIIGAPAFSHDQSEEGKAFVYYGSATGLSPTPGWTMEGNKKDAIFGSNVGTAGDVNKDGYSDIIIGAPFYNDTHGKAFVYKGSPSGPSLTPSWTADATQASSYFGLAVGTAGDVNKDGYSDVFIGVPRYTATKQSQGQILVYHGSADGLSASPKWSFTGEKMVEWLGFSAACAGDVNKDGYSDLVVGGFHFANPEEDEGRAYLFYGSSNGLLNAPSWSEESNQAGARFGFAVAGAGDVNKDGCSDILVAAPLFDNGETDEGRVFVYLGASSVPIPPATGGSSNNPPKISLSTTSLTFTGVVGGPNPPPQTLTVTNTGGGTLKWSVQYNSAMLTIEPSSGELAVGASSTVKVIPKTSGINFAGTFNEYPLFHPQGATGTSPENVQLMIKIVISDAEGTATGVVIDPPTGSTFTVSPNSFTFTAIAGVASPPPQMVMIVNSEGTLNWTASENTPWLEVTPMSGQLGPDEVAFLTVTANSTGLAANTYTTTLQVSSGGTPQSVAITLKVTAPGATNSPPNVPEVLYQVKADGITAIPEGGTISQTMAVFASQVFDPDANKVALEVELKMANVPFDGTNLLTSALIASEDIAIISTNGLANGPYHWRARTRDEKDATSDWKEFGTPGNTDFVVNPAANQPPAVPTKVGQFEKENRIIAEGATISTSEVLFKAPVMDPDEGDKVRLQIELKSFNQSFDEKNLLESPLMISGLEATVKAEKLGNGAYHWRFRAADQSGLASDWKEFGQSNGADFIVQKGVTSSTGPITPTPGSKSKKRCGMVGWEAIALLFLMHRIRK